jgi:hypothetical protein
VGFTNPLVGEYQCYDFFIQGDRHMPSYSRLNTPLEELRIAKSERDEPAPPKTMSIPEAGYVYFGLSQNGAYDAAARGELPFFTIGRLKRVSGAKMEALMLEGTNGTPSTQAPIEERAKAGAKSSKYPRSTAMRRRSSVLDAA